MDLAEKIAEHYNVLTGFKFIGEAIGKQEKEGRVSNYICSFEESYGYLTGSYMRGKKAVNAFYKTRGIRLIQKLEELYSSYGYCLNTLHSYEFPGSSGMAKIQSIMFKFHQGFNEIAGQKVINTEDYSNGINGLPKSDVMKFFYEGTDVSGSVVVRPSGTEPKLKTYISVISKDNDNAKKIENLIVDDLRRIIEV